MSETCPELLPVDSVLQDEVHTQINRLLLGTTAAMSLAGVIIGKISEEADPVELAGAMTGTGLLLTLGYNLPPVIAQFSWGRRYLEWSALKMEESQFASDQKQRGIDSKNSLRAEKPLIKELVERTRKITN